MGGTVSALFSIARIKRVSAMHVLLSGYTEAFYGDLNRECVCAFQARGLVVAETLGLEHLTKAL